MRYPTKAAPGQPPGATAQSLRPLAQITNQNPYHLVPEVARYRVTSGPRWTNGAHTSNTRYTSTYTGYMIVYASQGVGGTVGKDRAVRPRQPEGVSPRVPGFTPPLTKQSWPAAAARCVPEERNALIRPVSWIPTNPTHALATHPPPSPAFALLLQMNFAPTVRNTAGEGLNRMD